MGRSLASLHSLGCRVKGSRDGLCYILFQRTAPEAQTQRQFQVFHRTQDRSRDAIGRAVAGRALA